MTYDGPERRSQDEDERRQASIIVDELMRRIYQEMGRGVARKLVWLGFAVLVALAVKFGIVKVPM